MLLASLQAAVAGIAQVIRCIIFCLFMRSRVDLILVFLFVQAILQEQANLRASLQQQLDAQSSLHAKYQVITRNFRLRQQSL